MKIFKHNSIFGMANLVPKRTGLSVNIWSEHNGCQRSIKHNCPRVKISVDDASVEVSISDHSEILSRSRYIKKSEMLKLKLGMKYVERNSDLFLRHFNDVNDEFDDQDLFDALKARDEFR